MHIYIYVHSFSYFFSYRSLRSTEWSFLCCRVGPYKLSVLCIEMYMYHPNLPIYPSFFFLLVTINLLFYAYDLFLVSEQVHLYQVLRFHT